MNVVIFGASVVYGRWDKEGGWAVRLKKSYYEVEDFFVYDLGVPGDTSADLLARMENELYARTDQDGMDTTIIEIGVNDSQVDLVNKTSSVSLSDFRDNLIKLITICRKYKTRCILVGLQPVDERVHPMPWKPTHGYLLKEVKKYDKAIKDVAQEESVGFIEILSEFMKRDWKSLLDDGVHPNENGHKLIFELVKSFLLATPKDNP